MSGCVAATLRRAAYAMRVAEEATQEEEAHHELRATHDVLDRLYVHGMHCEEERGHARREVALIRR